MKCSPKVLTWDARVHIGTKAASLQLLMMLTNVTQGMHALNVWLPYILNKPLYKYSGTPT